MDGRHVAATATARATIPRQSRSVVPETTGDRLAPTAPFVPAGRSRLERAAFLELLSHELRTPVTSINAAAAILRTRLAVLDDDLRGELVEDIADETARLLLVIDDALVLTQLDTGLGLSQEPLLLQRIVVEVLQQERRQRPQLAIELRETGRLPVVRGDDLGVRQVVRNLTAEAGRAPTAGPIAVELEAADRGGARVRVISPPRERALEGATAHQPVRRASHAGQHSLPFGSIGIYTCTRLAQAMGGRSWSRTRADGRVERGLWLPAFAQMTDD